MEEKVRQYKYSVLEYLRPYLEHESVLKMKAYVQHGDVSTYRHCLNVACTACILRGSGVGRWMKKAWSSGRFCTTSIYTTGISESGKDGFTGFAILRWPRKMRGRPLASAIKYIISFARICIR